MILVNFLFQATFRFRLSDPGERPGQPGCIEARTSRDRALILYDIRHGPHLERRAVQ